MLISMIVAPDIAHFAPPRMGDVRKWVLLYNFSKKKELFGFSEKEKGKHNEHK